MFIRNVKKRNGRTKKVYEYLNLVESIRTEKGPRQRLVLNLGDIKLHPSQYDAFARRVEDIITGQMSFVDIDESLEAEAQKAARKIFRKQADILHSQDEGDYQDVDIESLDVEDPRSIGAEYICHSIWRELGLGEFLEMKGISRNIIPLIEAIVIGRLVEPASELHTKGWAESSSAVYELAGNPLRYSLSSYYRAGDRLYSIKEELESRLSREERDLFSLSEKMFFFDLTNSYFEGKALNNPKARWGRSKERRSDCKLVTLGLVIDETGFAKCSRTFPGNQAESETLEYMIGELESSISSQILEGSVNDGCSLDTRRTIVLDAGIATEENIGYLKGAGYHYIVVNRGRSVFERDFSDMEVIREDAKKGIRVEVKRFIKDDEVYILCRSEKKIEKERSMRTRVETLFLERLEYYRKGLSQPNRVKRYKKVVEVIGRLKERYPRAAKLYNVEVIPEDVDLSTSKLCAKDIVWEKKENVYSEQIKDEGSYVLRSDRFDLSDKEIWEIYVMLTRIEYAFRCMKSSLGLRPNFHQIEKRVDAHLFISVLAYHILHIIEYRLCAKGDYRTWSTIRDIMRTHQRVTVSFNARDDNGDIRRQFIRLNTKLEAEHLDIYRKLEISPVPLPRKKFVK